MSSSKVLRDNWASNPRIGCRDPSNWPGLDWANNNRHIEVRGPPVAPGGGSLWDNPAWPDADRRYSNIGAHPAPSAVAPGRYKPGYTDIDYWYLDFGGPLDKLDFPTPVPSGGHVFSDNPTPGGNPAPNGGHLSNDNPYIYKVNPKWPDNL